MTPQELAEQLERFPKLKQSLTELQGALAAAGVLLPGLRLHPSSFTDGDGIPLYDLGRCNMANANRLIEVLQKGAS